MIFGQDPMPIFCVLLVVMIGVVGWVGYTMQKMLSILKGIKNEVALTNSGHVRAVPSPSGAA